MNKWKAVRRAAGFFLSTFPVAVLGAVAVRLMLLSQLTKSPHIVPQAIGAALAIGAVLLVLGLYLRPFRASELLLAVLGSASVLLAIPVSVYAIEAKWDADWTHVAITGALLLAVGLFGALVARRAVASEEGRT